MVEFEPDSHSPFLSRLDSLWPENIQEPTGAQPEGSQESGGGRKVRKTVLAFECLIAAQELLDEHDSHFFIQQTCSRHGLCWEG